jgi:hypothetical protein
MCEKCQKFETDIQRYRRLVAMGLDRLTIERISTLIMELEQQKAQMHKAV